MLLRGLAFFCAFSLAGAAYADPTALQNASVRALGMGNAFTAVADDEASLFYNPAGLARVRGLNLKVFGVQAGINDLKAYEKLNDLRDSDSDSLADALSGFYGKPESASAGVEAMFTMPMLGFGVYDHASALVRVDNPVYPSARTTFINDYGYVAGIGVPAGLVHLGLDVKYIKRTGTDTIYGPGALADLSTETIKSNLTNWGIGYGADLGASVVVPAPLFTATISAVWKNMGKTEFRSENGSPIPSDDNDITLGTAFHFSLPLVSIRPAVDFTNLNRSDLQLTRKINFGIEIGLPLLDIRGGFHEGYYTAGAGVNLGLFRVDAATYGVELGEYPGQIEDRRYMVEFSMQLGLGNFSADGSSSSSGGRSGSSSTSSNSFWGGGRLKQRR